MTQKMGRMIGDERKPQSIDNSEEMMQRGFPLFLGVLLLCSAAPSRGDLPLDGGEDGWSSAWRGQVDGVMGGRYVRKR